MKNFSLIAVVINDLACKLGKISLMLTVVLLLSTNLSGQNTEPKQIKKQAYVQGSIIVRFKDGVSPDATGGQGWMAVGNAAADRVNKKYRCTAVKGINKRGSGNNTYVLQFPAATDVAAVVAEYVASGSCLYAEPDYLCSNEATTPNDPNFNLSWSLYNDGSFSFSSPVTTGADMKMKQAWDITQGSSAVTVAVIDAGAKLDHPEFSGRIWTNTAEVPGNGIDDDGNGYIDDAQGWNFVVNTNDPTDDNSHGTNVAGIIGANGNNGIGLAGVDWHCKLMILKTQNSTGAGSYSAITEAIYYATNNGAKVINMSLGGDASSSALQDAINYAYAHNVTIVAAAGNSNTNVPFYPAACSHVIAVGASTAADTRAYFSNYASYLSVIAPGNVIYGLWYLSNTDYTHALSGTSMASPHIAGLAALLLAQNATRTPDEIRTIIQSTADDMVGDPTEDVPGWDQYYGYGRANAYRALTYCATPYIGTVSGPSQVCAGSTGTYADTVSGGTWTSGNTSIATVSSTGIVTGIAHGTVSISYSKSNSCGAATAVKTITINTTPAAITGGTVVCTAYTTTLSNSITMGTWSSSNPAIATVAPTLTGNGMVSALASGTAGITYTTGCGTAATQIITVNQTPPAIMGQLAVCNNAVANLSNTTAGGSWISSNGNATINATTGMVTGITPGTATISYVLGNGCYSLAALTINGFAAMSTATPIITTLAGNGISGYGGNNGPATGAQLSAPWGMAINNTTGALYVADFNYSLIRKIDLGTGVITNYACLPGGGFTGDGGPATNARCISPTGLCIDHDGNIYFVDLGNNRVRKVNTAGMISTVAGNGVGGYSGDGGPATAACITSMNGLATDAAGNLYLPDYTYNVVRKVNAATNVITTIAGVAGSAGYSGDGGPATAAKLNGPNDVTVDNAGNIYISDRVNNVVRKINTSGIISTYAGSGAYAFSGDGGPATGAGFKWATGLDLDCSGNMNLCDVSNNRIRKIDGTGKISTIAGNGTAAYTGDGGDAMNATLSSPVKTVHDAIGNIYVSELNNNTVRKITITKKVCVGSSVSFCDETASGTWTSGNTAIATVSAAGVVTGVAAGTVSISLTMPSGYSITGTVIVNPLPTAITGTPVVCIGSTTSLNNSIGCGTWTCNPSTIATINASGIVTGIAAGTAVVSYTAVCGTVTRIVTVNSAAPSAITGDNSICFGGNTTLGNPVTGGVWSSANPVVALVDAVSGLVSGNNSGTSVITYTTGCGAGVVTTMNISATVPPITGNTNICMLGTTSLGNGTLLGAWSSSNTLVATVTPLLGVVVGVLPGTATISYTLSSGCLSVTTVTVSTLNAGTLSGPSAVPAASSITLVPSIPGGSWSSTNTIAATVSSAGVVTGIAVGSATISYAVTNACGTSYVSTNINVTPILLDTCSSWTIAGQAGVSAAQADYAAMAVDLSGTPYIAFRDAANGSKATVMKFAGGNWQVVGTPGLSSGSANYICIAIDAAGTPYVAYRDVPNGGTMTVSKFNGSTWNVVGTPAFTAANTAYPSLALDAAGQPYVAYTDNANASKSTVKKFNGSSWVTVGSGGLSTGSAQWNSIAIDGSGAPYVAYSGVDNKMNVRKFNGSSWVQVGSNSFSAGAASYITIAINGSGIPCIAFQDAANGNKATAMRFNGTSWSVMGTAGFSAGEAWYCTMAADMNGTPYVAYQDRANGYKASVMKFNGAAWVNMGNAAFSAGQADYTAIAIDGGGVPYVLYKDYANSNKATVVKMASVSSVTGTDNICQGTTTTLSNATATGSWSSSNTTIASVSSTGVVTGIAPGTIMISYTVNTSCGAASAVKQLTVKAVSGSITGSASLCTGATATLGHIISGGTWSSSNNTVATINGTGLVNGLTTGTAIISYTANNGCGSTVSTKTLTINTAPAAGSITAPATICAGVTTTISSDITAGIWSSSNSTIASVDATGSITANAAGTTTISYTVTNECGTATTTSAITVIANPVAGSITGASVICQDATTVLTNTVTGGVWSSSNNAIATIGSTGTVTGIANGACTISYTTENTCGSAYALAIFTVNPLPYAAAITGDSAICTGTAGTLTTSYSGSWNSSNTAVATVASSGIITGIAAGSAFITCTVVNSCGTATAVKAITVSTPPAAASISGSGHVITGNTITLSATPAAGTWSTGSTNASVNTTGVVTGTSVGAASISYTLTNTCGSTTATVVVTVDPVPVAAITGTFAMCEGHTTTLYNATGSGTWSSSNTSVATISYSGSVSGIAAGTAIISYATSYGYATVIVTVYPQPVSISSALTVCQGTTTQLSTETSGSWTSANPDVATVYTAGMVTALNPGTAAISYTAATGCVATTMVSVSGTIAQINGARPMCVSQTITLTNATGGGTWSSCNTGIATINESGIVTSIASGTTTITYSIGGGCRTTATVTVSAAIPLITGTAITCANTSVALSNNIPGGTWTTNNTALAAIDTNSGVATGISAGTAIITYNAANGCSDTASLTIKAGPAAITGIFALCAPASALLSNTSAGTSWTSSDASVATIGASSGVLTAVATGTATITYNTANGCYATKTISVNALPSVITGSGSVCPAATTTLNASPAGGTWTSTTTAAATITATGVVTGIAAGTTSIDYTTGLGCNRYTIVTVNPLPALISGPSTLCAGALTNMADATTGGTWSSGATSVAGIGTSGIINALSAGTAAISYTIPTGCTRTTTVSVSGAIAPISGMQSTCTGLTTSLSNVSGGGLWSSGNTSIAGISPYGVVTGVAAGTTNITYTINAGCKTNIVLTVNAAIPAITGPTSVCANSSVALGNTATGGTWTSSNLSLATVDSATGNVTGITAGSAIITYTVPNGCARTSAMTVKSLPAAIGGAPAICQGGTVVFTCTTPGGVSWMSSNTAVASVGSVSGLITGITSGTSVITYLISTGCYSTKTVSVNAVADAGTISGPSSVIVGGNITLTSTVGGGTWSSSTTSLATVTAGGVVTGVAAGAPTITYSLNNGCGMAYATYAVPVATSKEAGGDIAQSNAANTIRLYPNPTSGTFTVTTSVPGTFAIYTLEGRETQHADLTEGTNQLSFNNTLAAGIYMCRFSGTDGSNVMVRVVYEP